MSDSDDDRPLAARATTVKSGPAPIGNSAAAQRTGQPSTSAAKDPLKRRAAHKAPVIDESDSEDDQPLAARTKPAARPGSAGTAKKAVVVPAVKREPPKARFAAVKDEPLSPGAKSEPGRSPQKGATAKPTRVEKADGEKKVVVKKEYSNPGQTRETPSEVDPLHKFYTTLKQQRPDSAMAKKWCLIHGLLDLEEAEQLVAELKLKKGQTRSPVRAAAATAAARRSNAASATAPKRPAATSSKPAAKRKVKHIESDDEDDDDDFSAPAKKVQKQGSGSSSRAPAAAKSASRTASNAQAPKARPASGGSRPGSAGDPRKAAAEKPKSRPLVASTQKDKAFADGGLDPISDDSDDDKPLGRRLTKTTA